MTPLRQAVRSALGRDGELAVVDPNYVEREVQLEMAAAVADAIDDRAALVVEAGTGVGKTYAYLVPALLSGARTLLSTATKTLQDQLFFRDLPRLRAALNVPVTAALLKGRASYLCLHRLKLARHDAHLPDRFAVRALARIEAWSQTTATGDIGELDGLDERSSIIPLVTSTRENCVGSECPEYRQCHVMKARRDAMTADLVVVNHHLFFADMTLRDSGVAELLPSVEVALFDEAHQLAEAGVQFLGTTLGSAQLIDFARDLLGAGLQQARGLAAWQDLASAVDRAARELRIAASGSIGEVRSGLKLRWSERVGVPSFFDALHGVGAACATARQALDTVSELSPDFVRLAERAARFEALAARFADVAAESMIRWIDLSPHQVRLVESPLDIRDALREQMGSGAKAWIFTSATLGDDDRLAWFTESAGLEQARIVRLGSPFEYRRNAKLYVPRVFPKPSEPGHARAVAALAGQCARALGGRTFVLTTTLRSLQAVGAQLRADFDVGGDAIEVLVQGQGSKRQLMQRFLDAPHAVLVGSQSFWEGVDVPGEALQCVVIDKLPFPPPNDPLVEARVKRLEAGGRNPFAEYFVAEAAVSLKQGAGRLIRSETDRGLLIVCDPRMATMSYGRRLFAALPPMTRVQQEAEALAWLSELAGEPVRS
ncbi:MAG TPA: ATP-dependent DNA helicase [Caldimonas sp.]|jgi:ATP-dependent DNA helicase DinG|nr:ATP-dependent DNA helicase [Caldimonas sp.]HEX2542817.1 ATP-dependent DNA helicase [Caldimonas sp.]